MFALTIVENLFTPSYVSLDSSDNLWNAVRARPVKRAVSHSLSAATSPKCDFHWSQLPIPEEGSGKTRGRVAMTAGIAGNPTDYANVDLLVLPDLSTYY